MNIDDRYTFEVRLSKERLIEVHETQTHVKILQRVEDYSTLNQQIDRLKETVKQIIDENIKD